MLRDRRGIVSGKLRENRPRGGGVSVDIRHLANPSVLVALSFGLGLAPWMPGTFGAAGAFLLYPLVMQLPWAWQGPREKKPCREMEMNARGLSVERGKRWRWREGRLE